MTEAVPAPERHQMSARDRKRFLIALAAAIVLLFVGGAVAFLLDFRHHNICPGGAQWISRNDDGIGAVTYTCPGGKTVKEGLLP